MALLASTHRAVRVDPLSQELDDGLVGNRANGRLEEVRLVRADEDVTRGRVDGRRGELLQRLEALHDAEVAAARAQVRVGGRRLAHGRRAQVRTRELVQGLTRARVPDQHVLVSIRLVERVGSQNVGIAAARLEEANGRVIRNLACAKGARWGQYGQQRSGRRGSASDL